MITLPFPSNRGLELQNVDSTIHININSSEIAVVFVTFITSVHLFQISHSTTLVTV